MGTIEITPEALGARRLFNQYCYPDHVSWKYPEWKPAALAILGSGIFEGDELKGHARRKNYPVVQGDSVVLGDLIWDLVEKHFNYNPGIPFSHRLSGPLEQEILREFDERFRLMAAVARLGGVRKDVIEKKWAEWREQISTRAVEGKIPLHWRELIMDELYPGKGYAPKTTPQQIAHEFADIFLRYVAQAPPSRIVEWVNLTLKSLARPPASKSTLNDYIKKRQTSAVTPEAITE